ncbi:MAG: hypothetical protein IVW57_19645 [Ktedonobacterales bacterium]|nr:hypothetical protein [Ktedonobacterales bacterium]
MHGALTQEHPYRHNVFDPSAIPEAEAINQLDTAVSGAEAERIMKTAMERLGATMLADEHEARTAARHEANELMANITTAYHRRLDEMRLLEVVQVVFPKERERQESVITNHLRWMSATARSTLRHDPSLWGDQAHRQLEVRAHISVDFEDERERQAVERSRQAVGGFGERGPGYVPPGELLYSNDRARLQMLFSHHGISLSAIPFLADAAGGCVKALRDRQQIWETQGGIPVFTCDVMQDLVLRPGAFFDPAYAKATGGGSATSVTTGSPYGTNSDIMPSAYPTGSAPASAPAHPRNLLERVERRTRN